MMTALEGTDMELLGEYVHNNSEEAFRTLVERHINLVHAVALRQTGRADLAEDVTQAVFIVLAEKAATIPPKTILTGWLFRATRYAAANVVRTEARRQHWEQKAAQMEPTMAPDPEAQQQIAPLLHEALEELSEKERVTILLRFFESKSFEEVGRSLGITEAAAKMRLARAMEKLRLIFRKRGIAVSASALLAVLATQSASAAPAGLAGSVATAAFLKQTTAATLPIVKGTMLIMAKTKSNTLLIAAIVLLFGGNAVMLVQKSNAQKPVPAGEAPAAASKPVAAAKHKVLVFRDTPSWNRESDFEDVVSAMEADSDVKPSHEMAATDLAPYRFVVIPGNQNKTTFYQRFTGEASRFERYVTNGGTLVLELNGAENYNLPLPGGVAMVKHGSRDNVILVRKHPILSIFGSETIHAEFASHGYLTGIPKDALVLVAEAKEGKADLTRPTFVEYAYGKGRVLAACQCFHDRDGSGRGPLMETLVSYAMDRQWYRPKK